MPHKDPERRREYDRERSKTRVRVYPSVPYADRPYRYRYRPGSTPYSADYMREWRVAHPQYQVEHNRARQAVRRARAGGRLVPQPCEVCGAEQVEAHHAFGYSPEMALAVWWLCKTHHGGVHRAMRRK